MTPPPEKQRLAAQHAHEINQLYKISLKIAKQYFEGYFLYLVKDCSYFVADILPRILVEWIVNSGKFLSQFLFYVLR